MAAAEDDGASHSGVLLQRLRWERKDAHKY
jgi:hypothetical protein